MLVNDKKKSTHITIATNIKVFENCREESETYLTQFLPSAMRQSGQSVSHIMLFQYLLFDKNINNKHQYIEN